jgi:hypothetical protein
VVGAVLLMVAGAVCVCWTLASGADCALGQNRQSGLTSKTALPGSFSVCDGEIGNPPLRPLDIHIPGWPRCQDSLPPC